MARTRRQQDVLPQRGATKRAHRLGASSRDQSRITRLNSSRKFHDEGKRMNKSIAEDDLCPVCQQLLYRPVVTICLHHLCEACMAQWADVSGSSHMVILNIGEETAEQRHLPDSAVGYEVNCPMCRTYTSAMIDNERARLLINSYPEEYERRKIEDDVEREAASHGMSTAVQTLTIYIGNRNKRLPASNSTSNQDEKYSCTFFVKSSRVDIIEEVQIQLPSTFRPSRIIRTRPPFEVERVMQTSCIMHVHIILKVGYTWLSCDAVDSPDGAVNGMLPLEWTIDLSSAGGDDGSGNGGSMGRLRLKIMKEGAVSSDGHDHEQEDRELRRDRDVWDRMVREYQRDGLWDPGDDDED